MFSVSALGELLIDFTDAGTSAGGQRLFERNPGGAPANVLVALEKLGHRTAFLGKVGADMHGEFLRATLEEQGIDTRGLISDPDAFTTLAFVALSPDGEREFSFARKPGADTRITEGELARDVIAASRVFHVGSLSLTDEPARSATLAALACAREAGCVLSYDWPARLVVALVRSPQDVLVSDGEGLYLMESGEVQEVAVEDLPADRKDLCTVEVSKAFMDYMKRYGAPSSFLDILDLVAEVSQEYSWLITRMKYDNNTADGFGQLVLGLDPLHSELYVREPVSRQRISDSIRVIGQSMEEDPAGKIDFQTTHWDLYSKALVRRTVE